MRHAGDLLSEAATFDEFHGEVRPAVQVAGVVQLNDVGVAKAGHRLRLALEALALLRTGVGAGQEHLQGDGAVEPQVPRPVHDTHPAAPQHRLHLVAADPRQLGGREGHGPGGLRGLGRGEDRVDLVLQPPQPLQVGADLRQQLGARATRLLGAAARLEQLLQQSLHARVVGHRGPPLTTDGGDPALSPAAKASG